MNNTDSSYFHIIMNSSEIYQKKTEPRKKKRYIPKINSAKWFSHNDSLIFKIMDEILWLRESELFKEYG